MQPWRLHQSLEPILKPRDETAQDEQLLEDRGVLSDGLLVEPDLTAYLRHVDEPPGMLCEDLEQSRHPIEALDVGDVAYVALHECRHVTARPGLPALEIASPQHLGVAACQDRAGKVIADERGGGFADPAGE